MRRLFLFILITAFLYLPLYVQVNQIDADELEDELHQTQKQIQEKQKEKQSKEGEINKVEEEEEAAQGSLKSLQDRLLRAQQQLKATLDALERKQQEIEITETYIKIKDLELSQQQASLAQVVRDLYAQTYVSDLTLFLGADDFQQAATSLVYRHALIGEVAKSINEIEVEIVKLTNQKKELDAQRAELESERRDLKQQKTNLEANVTQTQNEINQLKSQQQILVQSLAGLAQELSSLTAREQEILAAKAAAALASTTVGNFEITRKSIEKDPPNDGQLYFSFWTYGYPHRVGMNQYGAYGRAKAGQSYQDILRAYYTGVEIGGYPVTERIKIEDAGGEREIDFEGDYLLGIAEMPSCWGDADHGGMEALKAQAVAARTYAIAYTSNGANSICTDQRCQVYIGASKVSGQCGDKWRQAVESTRHEVITYQGQPIKAWYASTAGGFTLSSAEVWGKAYGYTQGMADLDDQFKPYDGPDWGKSPWYHKAWGDEPWFSMAQVTDLANAALLPTSYNDLLPEESKGGMSAEQIKEALRKEGLVPLEKVTAVEVFGANSRETTKVRFYDESGFQEVSGKRFKLVFNLRSPGTDAIWTTRFDVKTNQ